MAEYKSIFVRLLMILVVLLGAVVTCRSEKSEIAPAPAPVSVLEPVSTLTPLVVDGVPVENAWTFTLNPKSADTFNRFEVKNQTSGAVTSTSTAKDGVISVDVTAKPGDVLSFQCWSASDTDWCASKNITVDTHPR